MIWYRLLVLVTAVIYAGPVWSGPGPSISFDREEHDYGKVAYGSTVTEHFRLTNKGDETLIIQRVRADCGCTRTINGSSEIPPNGQSDIVTEFDTTGLLPGRKQKHIYVRTNDRKRPEVILTLYADIVRELLVEPPSFTKRLDKLDGPVSFQFKITNLSATKRAISGIRVEEPGIHALLEPGRVEVNPNSTAGFKILLDLPEEPLRSFHSGRVILATDHPQEKEIELRYLIPIGKPKQ